MKHILGEGQTGVVFEVEHNSIRYAMKILRFSHQGGVSDVRRKRFEREIELLQRLDHPNVVRVHDSGVCSQSGQPFMVMDLITGGCFDEFITRKAKHLSLESKMQLFRGLLEGLCYLQRNSLVHRDIKPANIAFDDQQTPILIDFGLVKLMQSSLTNTFAFLGTPAYMAPEAFHNDELSSLSDQFSLATVAYEFLLPPGHFKRTLWPASVHKSFTANPPRLKCRCQTSIWQSLTYCAWQWQKIPICATPAPRSSWKTGTPAAPCLLQCMQQSCFLL